MHVYIYGTTTTQQWIWNSTCNCNSILQINNNVVPTSELHTTISIIWLSHNYYETTWLPHQQWCTESGTKNWTRSAKWLFAGYDLSPIKHPNPTFLSPLWRSRSKRSPRGPNDLLVTMLSIVSRPKTHDDQVPTLVTVVTLNHNRKMCFLPWEPIHNSYFNNSDTQIPKKYILTSNYVYDIVSSFINHLFHKLSWLLGIYSLYSYLTYEHILNQYLQIEAYEIHVKISAWKL